MGEAQKTLRRPFSRAPRSARIKPQDLTETIARFEALTAELVRFGAGDTLRTILETQLSAETRAPSSRPPLDAILKNAVVARVACDGKLSKNDVLASLIGTVADILLFYSDKQMSLIDAHVFSFYLIARIEKCTGQTWRDVYGARAEN